MKESVTIAATQILCLPKECIVKKWLGAVIHIECPTLAERDRIFADPAPLCKAAIAMGYDRMLLSVAGTEIRHRCKFTALLSFNEQVGG